MNLLRAFLFTTLAGVVVATTEDLLAACQSRPVEPVPGWCYPRSECEAAAEANGADYEESMANAFIACAERSSMCEETIDAMQYCIEVRMADRGDRQASLDAALALWEQSTYEEYSFDFQMSCECPYEYITTKVIVVEGGEVKLMSDLATQKIVNDPVEMGFNSIEGIFGQIQDAIDSYADSMDVSYNMDGDGHPVQVSVNWNLLMADEETSYVISSLRNTSDVMDAMDAAMETLESYQALWASSDLHDYVYYFEGGDGSGTGSGLGNVRVEVWDDTVASVSGEGDPMHYYTVDMLLERLVFGVATRPVTYEATYDVSLGYPVHGFYDAPDGIADFAFNTSNLRRPCAQMAEAQCGSESECYVLRARNAHAMCNLMGYPVPYPEARPQNMTSDDDATEVEETMEPDTTLNSIGCMDAPDVCADVLTYAVDLTGVMYEFPDSCVPSGWEVTSDAAAACCALVPPDSCPGAKNAGLCGYEPAHPANQLCGGFDDWETADTLDICIAPGGVMCPDVMTWAKAPYAEDASAYVFNSGCLPFAWETLESPVFSGEGSDVDWLDDVCRDCSALEIDSCSSSPYCSLLTAVSAADLCLAESGANISLAEVSFCEPVVDVICLDVLTWAADDAGVADPLVFSSSCVPTGWHAISEDDVCGPRDNSTSSSPDCGVLTTEECAASSSCVTVHGVGAPAACGLEAGVYDYEAQESIGCRSAELMCTEALTWARGGVFGDWLLPNGCLPGASVWEPLSMAAACFADVPECRLMGNFDVCEMAACNTACESCAECAMLKTYPPEFECVGRVNAEHESGPYLTTEFCAAWPDDLTFSVPIPGETHVVQFVLSLSGVTASQLSEDSVLDALRQSLASTLALPRDAFDFLNFDELSSDTRRRHVLSPSVEVECQARMKSSGAASDLSSALRGAAYTETMTSIADTFEAGLLTLGTSWAQEADIYVSVSSVTVDGEEVAESESSADTLAIALGTTAGALVIAGVAAAVLYRRHSSSRFHHMQEA